MGLAERTEESRGPEVRVVGAPEVTHFSSDTLKDKPRYQIQKLNKISQWKKIDSKDMKYLGIGFGPWIPAQINE